MSTRQNAGSSSSMPGDPYVRKIALLCDMHQVPFGSPANLAGFMRALEENKHLAMDFWAMVARMSEEEGGVPGMASGDARILEAIVQGVTGASVAEAKRAGGEANRLVTELASMLAGEDIHRPVVVVEDVASDEVDAAVKVESIEDAEASSLPVAPAALPVNTLPIREELPLVPLQAEPTPLFVRGGQQENRRIVLVPEPEAVPSRSNAKASFDPEDDESIVVPLSGYAERNPERKRNLFVLLAVLVILVGAGAFFAVKYGPDLWQRYGAPLRERYASGSRGGSESSVRSSTPAASVPSPAVPAAATLNGQAGVTATAPTPRGSASEPQAPREQRVRPVSPLPAPIVRQQAESVPAAPVKPRRRVTEEDDEVVDSRDTEAFLPVAVNPATMEANLVSSRVPAYPEAAKARGVEGRVVMQAIISKSGVVGHLRVISGDPALRSAATEAVSTWRYRPYLMNGQPVDVSTLVSVDFRLNR